MGVGEASDFACRTDSSVIRTGEIACRLMSKVVALCKGGSFAGVVRYKP